MPKKNYRTKFKGRNVCCGLKSQEALRPIGVARPMAMILTSTRETKSEGKTLEVQRNDQDDGDKKKMDRF